MALIHADFRLSSFNLKSRFEVKLAWVIVNNKQLLDEVFVISRIIKVEVGAISLSRL